MRLFRSLVVALGCAVAIPALAQQAQHKPDQDDKHAHEWWESWTEGFADFFIGPEKRDAFRWDGRLAAGKTLEVKGVNGRIVARPGTGDRIELTALKRGRRQDPKSVEIKVVEHAGGLTICALYPSPDPDQPNECKPGGQGRMKVRNNDVGVEFTIDVPEGVHFVGRTVNGSVKASGLRANVEAYTVNGSVALEAAGNARAETVNGSIRATLGKADWKDALAFKTVNGSVTVSLPAGASTAVRFETVNGSISNDFTLTGETRTSRRELSGTIGSGGRELSVKTVNGSVHLRRAS
jgi:hypothetical protein